MLLGFLRKEGSSGDNVPVFIPSHLTCYVGEGAYASILGREVEGLEPNRRDEPVTEIVAEEGTDVMSLIAAALRKPQAICCLRLPRMDEPLVARIAQAFPDESIYVLSSALPPLSGRPVSEITSFGKSQVECFSDFVGDVTGYRPRVKVKKGKQGYASHLSERPIHPIEEYVPVPKPKPIPTPKNQENGQKQAQKPVEFDWESYHPYPLRESLSRHIRRDLPNIGFCLIFILLSFATSMGYFFLAPTSSAFFRVICIIMDVIFPILACIPIGFIYGDNGRRLKPMTLTFALSLIILVTASSLCALIVLAVGNGYDWNKGEVLLHFLFLLSPMLWSLLRILFDPLLVRIKK